VKHELFPADELKPGEMRAVEIDSISIVVIRTPAGALHALRNRCSHVGAPLVRGLVQQAVVGDDVGQYAVSDEVLVRCPWHGWEFSVETGRCLADPEHARVRVYPVEVEAGMVVLER
jgi:nitrite reductase/ring-hydroxylating ferredoxin subunit